MSSTRILLSTLAVAATASAVALNPGTRAHAQGEKMMGEMTRVERAEARREMRQQAVRASEILRGNISNGLNPVGQTKNLVLDAAGNQLEYVIFEAENMPFEFYVNRGFVNWGDVDLQSSSTIGGLDLRADIEDRPLGPDEIRITEDEADQRLVSKIIDSALYIGDEDTRRIEDLLIDPETGEVTHFVVGWDSDSLFSSTRRAIPASAVTFEDGLWQTGMPVAEINSSQPYNPSLL